MTSPISFWVKERFKLIDGTPFFLGVDFSKT